MWSGRALREHMEECLEARRETNRRLDKMSEERKEDFQKLRDEIKERHQENALRLNGVENKLEKAVTKIDSLAWKIVLMVLAALLAAYMETHGFIGIHS